MFGDKNTLIASTVRNFKPFLKSSGLDWILRDERDSSDAPGTCVNLLRGSPLNNKRLKRKKMV